MSLLTWLQLTTGKYLIYLTFLTLTLTIAEQLIYRLIIHPSRRRQNTLKGKIALVSGGSEGIGYALVQELLNKGVAKVYIVARNYAKLQKAKDSLKRSKSQRVEIISCDVGQKDKVAEAVRAIGADELDYLFVNQGVSVPGYFLEQDTEAFEHQMRVNYFGGLYLTKALIPYRNRRSGMHVIFTGSTICFYTCVGFSSYGPSKYAIRGLVESLWSEFQGNPEVQFHLAMPADTKTPGFEVENLTKPPETVEISGVASCNTPEDTAATMVQQVQEGRFYITNDWGTFLLFVAAGGMAGPRNFPIGETLLNMLLPVPLLVVSNFMAYISRKYADARAKRYGNKHW